MSKSIGNKSVSIVD